MAILFFSVFGFLAERPPPFPVAGLVLAVLACLGGGYVCGAWRWEVQERRYLAAHPEAVEQGDETALRGGTVTPTEHPHVVRQLGVCGGSPIIRGTRVAVRQVAVLWHAAETVDAIVRAHPELQPSWVHDAISYYLDHRDEIDEEVEGNRSESMTAQRRAGLGNAGIARFPKADWKDSDRPGGPFEHQEKG
jgi:uncharacterized protein (DUF433 family)